MRKTTETDPTPAEEREIRAALALGINDLVAEGTAAPGPRKSVAEAAATVRRGGQRSLLVAAAAVAVLGVAIGAAVLGTSHRSSSDTVGAQPPSDSVASNLPTTAGHFDQPNTALASGFHRGRVVGVC